ncbi:MAG: hypothetical protein K9H25_12560 [Rhodospirillum sp.]|nr:hypothetical protein [Rhodospirillum sp.]MCF8490085.1 hypothetical protein [Rhodospirillum sp.]MCF8500444.1 hypothetical protein [Rhodospirillum sp.]
MACEKMWLVSGVMAAVFAIGGCSGTARVDRAATVRETGLKPELGLEATARVGDTIFQEYSYTAATRAVLVDGVSETIGFARVNAPQGTVLIPAKVGDKQAYCTTTNVYFNLGEQRGICFFDDNNDQKFDRYWVEATLESIDFEVPSLAYNVDKYDLSGGGFRKELIYQGRVASELRVTYREYVNDLARPAFTQDLVYEVDPKTLGHIDFRNVSIAVTEMGENKISYIVYQGF